MPRSFQSLAMTDGFRYGILYKMNRYIKILIFFILAGLVFTPFFYMKSCKTKKEPKPDYKVITGNISEGDVLGDILVENGISPQQTYEITRSLGKVFNVKQCNIGDNWEIVFSEEENFIRFTYQNGPLIYYTVDYDKETGNYIAEKKNVEAERKLFGVKGNIQSSLYESMSNFGVNPELIIQFAEIFASKIDFFTDCREDDEFAILWDSYVHNGEILKDIHVTAARYENSGNIYSAFYFKSENGESGYYDEKGNSVESVFLKAPLNYRRISSFFSYRRFHPILRIYRPHLGIDYAAPKGTPVSTIGDGTVISAGWTRSGYGIAVKVKHPNGYISYYGHLSKIRRGMRRGKRVKKGQVIGYVGSTGLSTGLHLDFRLKKNEKFINFLSLKMPPSHPLPKECLPEFEQIKAELTEKLENLEHEKVISFDESLL